MKTNGSPRNSRSGTGTAITMVEVQLRCKIPGVTVVQNNLYPFSRSLNWVEQLSRHGINVRASEHCIRRVKHGGEFNLDEPVVHFQQTFARQNNRKFVAILAMKGRARRGRTVRAQPVTIAPFPVRSYVATKARTRHVQENGTANTTYPPPRIVTEEIQDRETVILPRIGGRSGLSAASTRRVRNVAITAAAAVSAAPGIQNGHQRPGPAAALMNGYRDEDTEGGDVQGVDQKNICLDYISNNWNNEDTMQILRDIRELKRTNNYRAFTRLLPFTAGFLEEYAVMDRASINVELLEQRNLNQRDDDIQGGDADGITEKTRWLEHVRDHLSNADILTIRDELKVLMREDKYRSFLRLLPFTAGFLKDTFLDILA